MNFDCYLRYSEGSSDSFYVTTITANDAEEAEELFNQYCTNRGISYYCDLLAA